MHRSKAGFVLVLSSLVLSGCASGGNKVSSSATSKESASQETSQISSSESEIPPISSIEPITSSSEQVSSDSSEQPISSYSSSSEHSSSSESHSLSPEQSSQESSESEDVLHAITTKCSGYSVRFISSGTSYKAGDEVSFSLTSLGDYYSLKSVYYVEKGNNYPRTTIDSNDEGIYSFLMPDFDITLNVESERLYSITFSGSHFTYEIEEEQTYYKSGKKINFSLAIDEGYMLSGSLSGTYLSISSTDSGAKSLGIHENDDGDGYYFIMPEGDATINVPVEAKPVVTEDDPFTKAVTYAGTYHYTPTNDSSTTYYSTITISFSGDGMLTWGVTYYYETDDWGGGWDYKDFNPFTGYARFDKSDVNTLINTATKKYKFDASTNTLTFSAPGRIESHGDIEWVLKVSTDRNSDGLPLTLTFTQVVDSNVPQGMGSEDTKLSIV